MGGIQDLSAAPILERARKPSLRLPESSESLCGLFLYAVEIISANLVHPVQAMTASIPMTLRHDHLRVHWFLCGVRVDDQEGNRGKFGKHSVSFG